MRAPWTLWRSMLADLWRLLLLTTAALMVVIAFALTVKFFADGKLSPTDMLRFMALALVPMLQYALPFAGGFAATLVYHRMTNDNELSAAEASGISRVGVLAPAALTGVGLTALMLVLVHGVIPGFLYRMEGLVTTRVASAVEAAVSQGQALEQEGTLVYADAARVRPVPEGSDAEAELVLAGVVVVEVDEAGVLRGDTSASMALVRVYSGETADGGTGSVFRVWAQDAVVTRGGVMAAVASAGPWEWRVAGTFNDDPEFLTLPRLVALRSHPDWMNFIRQRKRDLAYHLAERDATRRLDAALREGGSAPLVSAGGDQTYVVHGGGIVWDGDRQKWRVLPGDGGVSVERVVASSGSYTRLVPEALWLNSDMGPDVSTRRLVFRLTLEGEVEAYSASGERASTRSGLVFEGLHSDHDFVSEYAAKTSWELLGLAEPLVTGPEADPFLIPPARELRSRLAKLDREITGQMHERMAYSAACLVMVLCGAVTAMRLSRRTPLVVYLWSFLPAVGTMILTSAGEEATQELGARGLVMVWSPLLALGAYTAWAARRRGL